MEMNNVLIMQYFLLIIWILIQAFKSFTRSQMQLPPGPKPFPIIGNLLELGDKPHQSLAKLSQSYAPIMRLKLGQVTTIVVSSAAMAKQVFQTHDHLFSNRTITNSLRACNHHEVGMPWIPVSPFWRNLRKLCNSHLFSSKALESNQNLRHQKIQELLNDVHNIVVAGEAVDIGRAAFKTSLNVLSTIFFSADWADPTSDVARELKETVWRIMEGLGKPNLADFFPLLEMVDPQGIKRSMTLHLRKMMDYLDRIINQRLKFRESTSASIQDNDMLDTLLNMMSNEDNRVENQLSLDKTTIEFLLLDLLVAGTDTTSSTVEWSMAELLRDRKTLLKAQEELEQVIGKGNQVKESDITRLPYLQAIVKETFRLHPAVPLVPRKAANDVVIHGYVIPKGAQVLVNVWAISRDPTIWDNPNEFKPERFLESNVDVKGRNFELTPFGGGRRICPGMPLATRMVPLMLGSLIHSFDWKLEDGVLPETLDMEDKFGLTLQRAQPLRALPSSKT